MNILTQTTYTNTASNQTWRYYEIFLLGHNYLTYFWGGRVKINFLE